MRDIEGRIEYGEEDKDNIRLIKQGICPVCKKFKINRGLGPMGNQIENPNGLMINQGMRWFIRCEYEKCKEKFVIPVAIWDSISE